ncbi:MAG: glycosyltransferase family 4 protein [Thermoplasmatales archaeon]
MKILWVAHRDPLNPKAGGAERIILEVGKRLVIKGYDVTFFAGGWKNCREYECIDGIHIYRYGFRALPHFILPVFLIKRHFDLVISDLGHAVPWLSPVLLRKRTIVSFLHLHARSLPGQVNFALAKSITVLEKLYFIFYNKQGFVTISNTSMQDLIGLGIKRDHIELIHPGVNAELFYPTHKTEHPSMVYYGGMRPYKRPEEAVYLLENLLQHIDNIHLTMIGDGVERGKLETLVDELNLGSYVTFTGKLTGKDLAKIVSEAWLNIHTSVTEGWGLSITEASAAGTPTVAYSVPGVVEAIEDGINGIKVKDGDRKALTDGAMKILSSPEKWWSSSLKVREKYSWDETARKWDLVLKEAMKSKRE